MGDQKRTFTFAGQASHPKNALALIYDLEGFSRFFNQPDVQSYVPVFLNHVSEAMGVCLFGGNAYWLSRGNAIGSLSLRVVHEKFMGDGALYILLPAAGESDFKTANLQALCNRLWNLKLQFEHVVRKALERVPVLEVPRRIRFGVSRGTVYELKKPHTTAREYIGFCINQASRLQSYCPDLGFIASARLMIPDSELKKHGYRKTVATQIRGFPNELVIVDSGEYESLTDELRDDLFKEPE
ncbi:MAG: adenylate/guanylate cyclase domain-containing protein [Planctomycetes bacterium]|nr:adenylate/guanylate cyclase domain-containing protein [Planctomycetota bacterium]